MRNHSLPIGRPPGYPLNRADDPAMHPAAAQIAVQSLPHLLLGRGGMLAQQAGRGYHHAGGAITALDGLLVDERLLDRMKPIAGLQPLHGDDRAVHGRHRQVAGRAGAVPDQHEARPAQSRPAAESRPGQAQVLAEHVEQRRIRLAGHTALRAVHGQPELGLHQDFPPVRSLARIQSRSFVIHTGLSPARMVCERVTHWGTWSWERHLLAAGFGCARSERQSR